MGKYWGIRRTYEFVVVRKSNKDFVEIYNAVSEKAKQGDDKAIKTFLVLQNELKKSVKTKKLNKQEQQEEIEEDDDLILE